MNRFTAFALGMWEFRRSFCWTDPARKDVSNDFTVLDRAYDWGREWAHRLTFRRWDY